MKINKEICHCSNIFLLKAEIQCHLHPAEANFGIFSCVVSVSPAALNIV
jgi:hypothetical protein